MQFTHVRTDPKDAQSYDRPEPLAFRGVVREESRDPAARCQT